MATKLVPLDDEHNLLDELISYDGHVQRTITNIDDKISEEQINKLLDQLPIPTSVEIYFISFKYSYIKERNEEMIAKFNQYGLRESSSATMICGVIFNMFARIFDVPEIPSPYTIQDIHTYRCRWNKVFTPKLTQNFNVICFEKCIVIAISYCIHVYRTDEMSIVTSYNFRNMFLNKGLDKISIYKYSDTSFILCSTVTYLCVVGDDNKIGFTVCDIDDYIFKDERFRGAIVVDDGSDSNYIVEVTRNGIKCLDKYDKYTHKNTLPSKYGTVIVEIIEGMLRISCDKNELTAKVPQCIYKSSLISCDDGEIVIIEGTDKRIYLVDENEIKLINTLNTSMEKDKTNTPKRLIYYSTDYLLYNTTDGEVILLVAYAPLRYITYKLQEDWYFLMYRDSKLYFYKNIRYVDHEIKCITLPIL
jgi:hypothetical protein